MEPIIYGSQDDWTSNLKTILEWSPFASKDDLMRQVFWMVLLTEILYSSFLFFEYFHCCTEVKSCNLVVSSPAISSVT